MSKPVTVTVGPAVVTGHESPHFDADGDCLRSCASCTRVIEVRWPGVSIEDCVCPDCPCRSSVTARAKRDADEMFRIAFGHGP